MRLIAITAALLTASCFSGDPETDAPTPSPTFQISATETAPPTVDEVVAQYLDAIGGVEAHKKQTTLEMEGTFTIVAFGSPWELRVTQKAPNLKHFKVETPAGVLAEGYDGKVGWKKIPGKGTEQITGDELRHKERDAYFYSHLDIKSRFETLTYEGRYEGKGKAYHVLKGTYEDGRDESMYIDVKTHLIGLVKKPEGTVELSDYREIVGMKVPFTVAMSPPGETEASLTMKFEKVTYGVEVDDGLFALPTD